MSAPSGAVRVAERSVLTPSTGRDWVVFGVLLAAASLAVLLPLSGMQPDVALAGAGGVLALLVGMGAAQAAIPWRRIRMAALAILFGAMAAVALTSVMVAAAAALS